MVDFINRQTCKLCDLLKRKTGLFHLQGYIYLLTMFTLCKTLCMAFGKALCMAFGKTLCMALGEPLFYRPFCYGEIVTINFDTFLITFTLTGGQGGHLTYFRKSLEGRILSSPRHSVKNFHILQYIYPTVKESLTFFWFLVKLRKLKKNHPHPIAE